MQHFPNTERPGIKEDQSGALRSPWEVQLEEVNGDEIMRDQVTGKLGCGVGGVPQQLTEKLGQFWVK